MSASINHVVLLGNLTADPQLRHLPSGTAVCELRLAVDDRVKATATGQWTDYTNYFDVTVFGPQGERVAQYLAKGRQVAVDGRLRWRSWEKDGRKRSKVEVVADTVQFVGPREGGSGAGAPAGGQRSSAGFPADGGFEPADEDFGDDIPF
jgi:single-strand DNA-binding protein